MSQVLEIIDSCRNEDMSYADIARFLKERGHKISIVKVWYLATFGSRNPGKRLCAGPNCNRMIRKIANTKYCTVNCQKEARIERKKEEDFMEVAD